jgi:hypothetical protein
MQTHVLGEGEDVEMILQGEWEEMSQAGMCSREGSWAMACVHPRDTSGMSAFAYRLCISDTR